MAWELPCHSGLCCSAGVTAGMASLAACSTWRHVRFGWGEAVGKGPPGRLESRPQARKPAPQEQPAPHHGGQECQHHTRRLLVSRGGESSQADHRHDCRCGTQDCVLHAEADMASRAGCSTRTGGVASVAACSTWRRRLGGGEQWVKGAKAGWKACPTSDTTWRARKKQTTARQSRNQTGVAA